MIVKRAFGMTSVNWASCTATLSVEERVTLDHALEAYGFILGRHGSFTGQQWVDAIAKTFDAAQPRHAEVIRVILKASAELP